MKKTLLSFYALFLFLNGLFAQNKVGNSKLNIDLLLHTQELMGKNAGDKQIPILIECTDINRLKEVLQQYGGIFKFNANNLASVNIPAKNIFAVSENAVIQRMVMQRVRYTKFNDTLRINTRVDSVQAGLGGLPKGFTGAGTILATIDEGLDVLHPDFKAPNNKTRIRYLWHQDYDTIGVEPIFQYGYAWDSTQINAGKCTYYSTLDAHGSAVTGVAAGNGRGGNANKGVAPEADILHVSVKFNDYFMNNFIDAVSYIYTKADAIGKPCAINSSVGNYYGSHDGRDLYARFIDNLLAAKPGRTLAQAAGNAGGAKMHYRVNQVNDTAAVWFKYENTTKKTHFVIFADTADFNNINFSLTLIDGANFAQKGNTDTYNILSNFNLTSGHDSISEILFYDANNLPVKLKIYADQYDGIYEIWCQVISGSSPDYWQLNTTGWGKFDIWSHPITIGTSEIVATLPAGAAPRHYRFPDDNQTIVSSWGCSDKVILVGSYGNRDGYFDYTNVYRNYSNAFPRGRLSALSSKGPTRDGRIKPDITAPGTVVLTTSSVYNLTNARISRPHVVARDGWHIANSGTSFSSPVVAGLAALYMQCQSDANYQEVNQAIRTGAMRDAYVTSTSTNYPNANWGYGKVNAMTTMKKCLVYGCTNPQASNYDPNANIDNGSCLVSVTKPTKPTNSISPKGYLYNSPTLNPMDITIYYQYPFETNQKASLNLYDVAGKPIFMSSLQKTEGQVRLEFPLAAGAYFYSLVVDGKVVNTKSLIVAD